jgi:hypothetical protein
MWEKRRVQTTYRDKETEDRRGQEKELTERLILLEKGRDGSPNAGSERSSGGGSGSSWPGSELQRERGRGQHAPM